MGRVDLSRHRKVSPSDTRPAKIPESIQSCVALLREHPHDAVRIAGSSITGASTQRTQVAALKMIGFAIRDSHVDKDDGRGKPLCSCKGGSGEPICHLAGSVLAGFLLHSPDATAGLIATALRGLLRAGVTVPVVDAWKGDFFDLLEEGRTPGLSREEKFIQLVCNLSTTAAMLSEAESTAWILDHPLRLLGSFRDICEIAVIYAETSVSDNRIDGFEDPKLAAARRINESYNRKLLESACDAAMKNAQDLLGTLHKKGDMGYIDSIREVVDACASILSLPTAPRNCSIACAVAYVTGTILLSQGSEDTRPIHGIITNEVLIPLLDYPPFSQLSLLRAIMEAPAATIALQTILYPNETRAGISVFEKLASITTANADVHLRFLAMEALIACIRRRAPHKLDDFCRDIVLSLVYERWQEPFPGVTAQIRQTMEALVTVDGGEESTPFWVEMATTLANGDWNCKGMHAPLGVLVKRIGALRILQAQPDCQRKAMLAAAVDHRLSKHIADWLGAFWVALRKDYGGDTQKFLQNTCEPLVEALVHEGNSVLRERVAEHVLPVYFRSAPNHLVEQHGSFLLTFLSERKGFSPIARIRGTIAVMSIARKNGVFIGSFTDSHIFVLLQQALMCGEEDMRASALELVVTCRVSTEPVLQEEFDLVLGHMVTSLMPGGSLCDRSKFRHAMRTFFERLAACRHAAREGSSGWWMRERKDKYGGKRTAEFEEKRLSFLKRSQDFETACLVLLLASSYPGALFSRRSSALEVMHLLSKNLGFHALLDSDPCLPATVVTAVLEGLLDEWARPRRKALEVVSSLSAPLPVMDDIDTVQDLQKFALPLLNSPKQKEVDAGASLYRSVFRIFVLGNKWSSAEEEMHTGEVYPGLSFPGETGRIQEPRYQSNNELGLAYVESIMQSIEYSLNEADQCFSRLCETGLFHGRFLLLRYILQDLPWKELITDQNRSLTSFFVERFLDLCWNCTQIGMRGVSFKALGEDVFHEKGDEEVYDTGLEEKDILLREKKQMEITACFLTMKEICLSLGILCHEIPFEDSTTEDSGRRAVLNKNQVETVGNVYLHVFMNTRHWGVIDGASEGFQLLCERLLLHANINLRCLPKRWAHKVLARALNGDLYVLRRSAGIPALIGAIVNAESVCCKRSHESPLLFGISSSLLDHLEKSDLFVHHSGLSKERSKEEEAVAHALNLLRSLFLNGNIASGTLRHLERTAMCCIQAFCSVSWLIRNSAMMLFSALVRRGIGTCTEKREEVAVSSFAAIEGTSAILGGDRRLRGITAFQFFSRHPKLHPFLLNTLEMAIVQLRTDPKQDHPALYPTLYLLSCLSPAAAEDPSKSISMKPFRLALRSCTHWRSDYVRRVAAFAYVSLIEDPSHVSNVVQEFLSAIPEEPDHVTAVVTRQAGPRNNQDVNGSSVSKQIPPSSLRLSQNVLHGDLLTITAILSGTESIMSIQDKMRTVEVFSQLLPSRLWIVIDRKKNRCSYTRSAMLAVLYRAYILSQEVVPHCQDHSTTLLAAKHVSSLSVEIARNLRGLQKDEGDPVSLVGWSNFSRRAVGFSGQVTINSFESGLCDFADAVREITSQVSSPDQEIRLAGIKNCLRLMTASISEKDVKESFEGLSRLWHLPQLMINSNLPQEQIVDGLRMQISILELINRIGEASYWQQLELGDGYISSVLRAARHHACVDVREYALVLAGKLVSMLLPSTDLLEVWMTAVEQASKAQETTTRISACTSVANGNLRGLKDVMHEKEGRNILARGYLVLCKLLEDDYSDVRHHAAKMAEPYLRVGSDGSDLSLDILPTLMGLFGLLSKDFGDCESLLEYLTCSVQERPNVLGPEEEILLQQIGQISGSDYNSVLRDHVSHFGNGNAEVDPRKLPSRLFRLEDEEVDGEEVLRTQMISWCFRDVIRRTSSNATSSKESIDICTKVTYKVEAQLQELTTMKRPGPLGRPVFTSKGFLEAYRAVVQLYLAVCCCQSAGVLNEELSETAKVLKRVRTKLGRLLHPVLYFCLQGLSRIVGDTLEGGVLEPSQQILFLLPRDASIGLGKLQSGIAGNSDGC